MSTQRVCCAGFGGHGKIGREGIVRIINHPALRNLPFYLETPNDLEGYGKEISFLREAWIEP